MSTTRRLAALLAGLGTLATGGGMARADFASGLESVGLALGYVVPLGCSAGAAVFNGSYMAVGEGSPMYLRTTGVVCGVVAMGVGTYVLIDDHETGGRVALGVVPIGVGLTSVLIGLFVGPPEDYVGGGDDGARLTPFFTADGGGLSVTGRF